MEEIPRIAWTYRLVIATSQTARSAVEALSNKIAQIWGKASGYDHLSPQGRQAEASIAISEGSDAILAQLVNAGTTLSSEKRTVEAKIEGFTGFSDEAIAAVFAPLLSGALDNQDALLNLYARRFENALDRRVLEEAAEVVLDGLAGSDGGVFHQRWEALKQQLDARRHPDERQAVADLAALEELEDFLGKVKSLAGNRIDALGRGGPAPEEQISNELLRSQIDTFISLHSDPAAGDQGAAQDMWPGLVNPGGQSRALTLEEITPQGGSALLVREGGAVLP